MKGFLITFEGIDFSGKSLQAKLLHERLLQEKLPVVFLREPGGTEISERVRDLLLDTRHHNMDAHTEILLYSAARAQVVAERIIPHLQKGMIVICDRYFDSTTAYQGYGRQIDLDFISNLHKFATQGVSPHLTFLIDLEPAEALKRKQLSNTHLDRLEKEEREFHRRVREGYLAIARSEALRFVVIDGAQPVDNIQKEIFEQVKSKLKL
jgi:dTMP kinase